MPTGIVAPGPEASGVSVDSTTLVGTGTTVQAVLEELDNGIADHLADAVAAHAASAVSFTPVGTIAATDVQTAIAEVATDAAATYQPLDADLTALAALATAVHKGVMWTGAATPVLVDFGVDVALGKTWFGTGSLPAASTGTATAVGHEALYSNTTGTATAVGHYALHSNTTGTATAVGHYALYSNTTGTATAVGKDALHSNTTGTATAVGHYALYSNTTGAATAVGTAALYSPAGVTANASVTAVRQVGVGEECGQGSATQSNDITTIGYRALADGTGATSLGSGANAAYAGSIALGLNTVTTAADQLKFGARHMEMVEITAPAAGAANSARIYAVDNGAGKTQLMVQFATGAAVQLAIEP